MNGFVLNEIRSGQCGHRTTPRVITIPAEKRNEWSIRTYVHTRAHAITFITAVQMRRPPSLSGIYNARTFQRAFFQGPLNMLNAGFPVIIPENAEAAPAPFFSR